MPPPVFQGAYVVVRCRVQASKAHSCAEPLSGLVGGRRCWLTNHRPSSHPSSNQPPFLAPIFCIFSNIMRSYACYQVVLALVALLAFVEGQTCTVSDEGMAQKRDPDTMSCPADTKCVHSSQRHILESYDYGTLFTIPVPCPTPRHRGSNKNASCPFTLRVTDV